MSRHEESVPVLVEVRLPSGAPVPTAHQCAALDLGLPSFHVEPRWRPVGMAAGGHNAALGLAPGERSFIARGHMNEERLREIESGGATTPNDVVEVWRDFPVVPFAPWPSTAQCPDPGSCECCKNPGPVNNPACAHGFLPDVRAFLGLDAIQHRGKDVILGMVDSGLAVAGRALPSWTKYVFPADAVPDGWAPPGEDPWGSKSDWGEHGNFTAYDARKMAPRVKLYDIRITDAFSLPRPNPPLARGMISAALAGYEWALNDARPRPHVLSNSWGILQEVWAPRYATDPKHPFTRKVVEAVNAGIVVLFAAGNCGGECPDPLQLGCGGDTGTGRSIWGANGHPKVITVGAATVESKLVGYSSQGPPALKLPTKNVVNRMKPDISSISHFRGYYFETTGLPLNDVGTSAATAIAAGLVAVLRGAHPDATPVEIKHALQRTAAPHGAPDLPPQRQPGSGPDTDVDVLVNSPFQFQWNPHWGAGIVRAEEASEFLRTNVLIKGT